MVEEKLNILQYAMNIKNNARICGEFEKNHSFLDSDFGINNSTITMEFKYENGNPKEDALVSNTVLNSNIEKEVKIKYYVIAVLEKRENAIKYNNIVQLCQL